MKFGSSQYHASLVLDEHSLWPAHGSCPWCGSARRSLVAVIQDVPEVTLLRCADCQAASVSRMPTEAALDRFYGGYYKDKPETAGGDAGKFTFGDADRMAAHLARWIIPATPGGAVSILDFGGGDGTLSMLAAAHAIRAGSSVSSASVCVVDYNQSVSAPAHASITLSSTREISSLADGTFDLVIASAVMEHIPAGRAIMTELLAKVRPGGCFYARTPYVTPFMRLMERLGRRWDLTFPAHVHDLGQAFWEGQFGRAGFYPEFETLSSRPSIVEASFRTELVKASISLACKLPWFVLGRWWGFVGGWEIVARKAP